jgi:hypothetical protein
MILTFSHCVKGLDPRIPGFYLVLKMILTFSHCVKGLDPRIPGFYLNGLNLTMTFSAKYTWIFIAVCTKISFILWQTARDRQWWLAKNETLRQKRWFQFSPYKFICRNILATPAYEVYTCISQLIFQRLLFLSGCSLIR